MNPARKKDMLEVDPPPPPPCLQRHSTSQIEATRTDGYALWLFAAFRLVVAFDGAAGVATCLAAVGAALVAATRRYSRWYDSYWGIPECYFHTVAAVPIFALAACQRLDLAFGDDPRDDSDPHNDGLAHFARAWSALVGLALVLDWPAHCGLYRWYFSSGIQLASRRGLGFNCSKPYGVLPMPALSPRAQHWLGVALATFFALAADADVGGSAVWGGAFGASWLGWLVYNSQLGQDVNIGNQKAIVVPGVLVYLAAGLPCRGAWALSFVKLHLFSLYFTPGLLKVGASVAQRVAWTRAPTIQSYLFASLWSRPAKFRAVDALARRVIATPPLCALMACGGLAFELALAPCALASAACARVFALAALGFHFSIFLVMGINFSQYWAPAALAFLCDAAPLARATLLPPRDAPSVEWALWGIAAAHLAGQLFFAFTFHACYSSGPLPYSCMPVFAVCNNIFDSMAHLYTLIGGSHRCAGQLSVLEWRGPVFADEWFDWSLDDMLRLPFPICWLLVKDDEPTDSRTERVVKLISANWKPEFVHKRVVVFSNLELTDELTNGLRTVARLLLDGDPSFAYDPAKMRELLDEQAKVRREFDRISERGSRRVITSRQDSLLQSPRAKQS